MLSLVSRALSWSRRHRTLVGAGTLGLAIASVAGIQRLTFDADVLALLPRDGRAIPAFRTFVDRFGSLDHLYVVFTAPAGYSIVDYDGEIEAWIAALREAPEIARVDTGLADSSRDLNWLADRQLLLLPDDALEDALARFQPTRMREAIASRRELLVIPSPVVATLVRNDPLGLFDLLRREVGGSQAGVNVGLTEGGYVTPDGTSRMIIALPAEPPYDTDFSRRLFASLDSLRADLAQRANSQTPDEERPRLDPVFAGGHLIALETEALVRRESIVNTVGSLALILPLLWFVYRSFWLVIVGPLPSAASLLIVLGVLGMMGATLSAAATASAAMLFGLGIDGVVLLYVAYSLSLANGADAGTAAGRLEGPGSSMLLGMWTTAATFYGLAWVDFPSLEQLGLLIGHSMVLCGIFTLVIVAALLPRQRPARAVRLLTMPRLAAAVERRSAAILGAALIVTLALGAAATGLRINPSLDRLRLVTPGARLQEQIGPTFGLPRDVHVIVAGGSNLDALLSTNERLVERLSATLPRLGIQAPSTLLPAQATQAHRRAVLRTSGLTAESADAALLQAADAEGFRRESFDPFRRRLPALLDAAHSLTYDGYVQNGLGDLIGRFVARRGDEWYLATYVFPDTAAEVADVAAVVESSDPSGTLTGLSLVNRELADGFVPQFAKGLAIGTFVVVCLVIAAFRDWWLTLLALAPTLLGLVWAAGVLALAGFELDLFAVFAVATFVGIGVDYGIHLVHRYRERGNARRAIEELAPVILVAAAITLIGYGTLVTSSYPPLRSIGVVAAVSVATLAVASVVVLPAMLAVRSRRVGA